MSVISFHDIGTDMVIRVSQDSSDCAPWQTVFRGRGTVEWTEGQMPGFQAGGSQRTMDFIAQLNREFGMAILKNRLEGNNSGGA